MFKRVQVLYAVGTLAGNQSLNGDRLGYLTFVNDNNSASYKYSAWLGAEVDGTTTNQQGGRLIFSTMGDGSSAGPIERMRITQAGNVGIGTSKLESLDGDIKVTTQSAFAGFITSRNTIPSSGGTQLGRLQYSAYSTGTTYVDGAAIQAFSTEAWSASSTPSWLSLQTVASGSTSLVERVRIDSDGLKFNGDTAAANALDDYEEGTWTPIVNDLTNEATMISGTTGFYTKIGRQVTLSGYVRTTSIGSVSGDVYIGGMPFTSNGSLGSETSVTFGYFTAMNLGAAGVSVGAYIVPATTRMALYINDVATGITAMQGSEWGNTGYVHLGIILRIKNKTKQND
jgi:hypothetical protein